jgi:hypothetical protein
MEKGTGPSNLLRLHGRGSVRHNNPHGDYNVNRRTFPFGENLKCSTESCYSFPHPLSPTPGNPTDEIFDSVPAGMPRPVSLTSSASPPANWHMRMSAMGLSEWRWMLVRHSCTIRNAIVGELF